MKKYHLAQLNIAKAKANLQTNLMYGFTSRIDEINQLAEKQQGFIWRLDTDDSEITGIEEFDNPLIIVNMSVWDSLESLKKFVYKSNHIELLKQKKQWFNKMDESYMVLWWIEKNHIPSLNEAKIKLDYLRQNGVSEYAFNFAKSFDKP